MGKKSQVKFGESIGIILIVFFIVFSGLIWYDKINTNSINKINKDDQFTQAFEKYYYFKELDLIHTSKRGIIEKELNLNSLITFGKYSKTYVGKEYLRKRLKFSLITISIFKNNDLISNNPYLNITLYNNTPIKEIKEPVIFISYFPVKNENKKVLIGRVKVISYII